MAKFYSARFSEEFLDTNEFFGEFVIFSDKCKQGECWPFSKSGQKFPGP